jgi:uncharacterized protein
MTIPRNAAARRSLGGLPEFVQWGLILAASVGMAVALELVGIPAALLLGPMITGVAFGTNGATIRVPRLPYWSAQAVVGCLIAGAISSEIVVTVLRQWPLFLGIVIAVIAASSVLGWSISRLGLLPGTTAVWGSSPGAATAMMLMAEAFGADARLVAFMQYLRVVFVAVAASAVARLWVDTSSAAAPPIVWFPPIDWGPFLQTLSIAGFGVLLGRMLRVPAGALLVPLAGGAMLHAADLARIQLPEWLLAVSYAVLGWNIGLGFTRAVLVHASRALLQVVLSTVVLISFCASLAFVLSKTLGIDLLTAYLATSPGGMDSVAIIAASSKVDLPFVMALQTLRFVIVVVVGPPLARFIAKVTSEEARR